MVLRIENKSTTKKRTQNEVCYARVHGRRDQQKNFAFLTENPVIWSALAPKTKTKLTTAHSTKKNSPQQIGEKVMAYVRIPLLKRHLETVEYFDGRGGKNTHL